MKKYILIVCITLMCWTSACTQPSSDKDSEITTRAVGGPCEDCKAVFEYGSKALSEEVTLPDYLEDGPRMEISGTIYQRDGKTPAAGVILYVYHTNQQGEYPTKGNEKGWAKRHGYIRGWIKTDATGNYKFYTLKPAAYPGRKDPAHIHATIKEPGVSEYWIDEYLFDDDPLLTPEVRRSEKNRGGSGILKLTKNSKGVLVAQRDIILGLNIPEY